jgi:flagellar basal body rod protein FlgC
MIPAITLSGLQRAEYQVGRSASRIVNAMSVPVGTSAEEDAAAGAVPAIPEAGDALTGYMASDVSLAAEAVSMTEGAQAYKANIAVFRVWDEMMQETAHLRKNV